MPLGYETLSGKSITALLQDYESRALRPHFGAALYREGLSILRDSGPLVPVDTGALRSSGYVTPPEWIGNLCTVNIGYGGTAARINPKTGESTAGYAIFVHENLEAHHPVGSAKYLEIPFNEHRTGMAERIAGMTRAGAAGAIFQAGGFAGEEGDNGALG